MDGALRVQNNTDKARGFMCFDNLGAGNSDERKGPGFDGAGRFLCAGAFSLLQLYLLTLRQIDYYRQLQL